MLYLLLRHFFASQCSLRDKEYLSQGIYVAAVAAAENVSDGELLLDPSSLLSTASLKLSPKVFPVITHCLTHSSRFSENRAPLEGWGSPMLPYHSGPHVLSSSSSVEFAQI